MYETYRSSQARMGEHHNQVCKNQGKGILEGWGGLCLLIFLLLQYPGVYSKCYFQAQGKAGPNPKKKQGQIKGLGIAGWLRDVPVSEPHNFYSKKKRKPKKRGC